MTSARANAPGRVQVDRAHPLWEHLLEHGLSADELAAFVDTPCPPNVVGLNYYVTSERLLQ